MTQAASNPRKMPLDQHSNNVRRPRHERDIARMRRAAEAARVLASITAPQSAAQSLERSLLDAQTSLVAGRAQEAWQKISAIPESAASATALSYYSLKMRIALAAAGRRCARGN